jgi:RNA polymerase sigma-70 factor (ECF subfamily)
VDDDFTEYVYAQSTRLLRLAWMLTGESAKAQDLLQATLTRVWPHWKRISANGSPDAYVRRVMINLATAWARRRWRFEIPTDNVPERAAPDETAVRDDRDLLVRALASLPARQRAIIVLRYYDGLTEQEVATILECSIGSVKSQASRGLATLRSRLAVANPKETV